MQKEMDFPISDRTRERIKHHLRHASVNYPELALDIIDDPALCWHLSRLIARQRRNLDAREQLDARACVSLLGMQRMADTIKTLPTHKSRHGLYATIMSVGALAAQIASHLAKITYLGQPEELRWQTLLCGAPFWPWFQNESPAARQMLYFMSQGRTLSQAIITAFGDKPKEWQNLAKHIGPSLLCQQVLASGDAFTVTEWQWLRRRASRPKSKRELNSIMRRHARQPRMLIAIAWQLAYQLHINPQSRHALRWVELAAVMFEQDKESIQLAVRQAQLGHVKRGATADQAGLIALIDPSRTARHYPPVEVDDHEAQDVTQGLTPSDHQARHAAKEIDRTQRLLKRLSPDATPPVTPLIEKRSEVRAHRHEIKERPVPDWHKIIQTSLDNLLNEITVSGACVWFKTPQSPELKCTYVRTKPSFSKATVELETGLSLDLSVPSIFAELSKRASSMRISDTNVKLHLRHLPPEQWQPLPSNFALMSLKTPTKILGVVMIYNTNNRPIDEACMRPFRRLCREMGDLIGEL